MVGNTWKHSETLGNTRKHSEPLGTARFRSETVGEGKVLQHAAVLYASSSFSLALTLRTHSLTHSHWQPVSQTFGIYLFPSLQPLPWVWAYEALVGYPWRPFE